MDKDGHESRVAAYYDANTRVFLARGQGGASWAIHRAVRAPGVRTITEAMGWVDGRIAELGGEPEAVLDLGCGVGGSMVRLARRWPKARFRGLTLSASQAELGAQVLQQAGIQGRALIVVQDIGSACLDHADRGVWDLAYAVESMVHMPHPAALFASAARALRTGGMLVICDDFLVRDPVDRREAALLERFRAGWRTGPLLGPGAARSLARGSGFTAVREEDLTPWLVLGRPRDRAIRVLLAVAGPFCDPVRPFWGNLVGGDALQRLLRAGVLGYRLVAYRKD